MRSLRVRSIKISQILISSLITRPTDLIQLLLRVTNPHIYPPVNLVHANKLNVLQIVQDKVWPRRLDLDPLMSRQQADNIAVCGFTSADARGCILDHEDSGVVGDVKQGAGEEVACEG